MRVLKFGGTSVGSPEAIKSINKIIKASIEKSQVAVVVSAFGGITNDLITAGKQASVGDENYKSVVNNIEQRHVLMIETLFSVRERNNTFTKIKIMINDLEDLLHGVFLLRELSPKSLDLIISFGERMSASVIADYLTAQKTEATFVDARKIIRTDNLFGVARVDQDKTAKLIREHLKEISGVPVITGFIASTENDETTTIGRGGSDYTASIIGAAMKAKAIEIWTDVDGVMSADPRQVKSAFSLLKISYQEAMEMSHFGAKVIYPPTIQPALNKNIPIYIKNTFNPEFEGTLISQKKVRDKHPVKGVFSINSISLINIQGSGMVGVPGIASRMFGALARAGINIILITQASSEYSICLAVQPDSADDAKKVIEKEFELEIDRRRINEVVIDRDMSIVAIIGENMRHTKGIAANLFSTLGHNGINVVAIAQGSSELNISVVIESSDLKKALVSLHESFFLSEIQTLNVFIVGIGLIGGKLIEQFIAQQEYLQRHHYLRLRIIGVANSRKMYIDEEGIPLKNYKELITDKGEKSSLKKVVEKMKELNMANMIFVDCTSSEEVVSHYEEILKSSISIVTPNKLANSRLYFDYENLQKMAQKHGVSFSYETNVGAGLPIINTLKGLKLTGDKITRIEGILSGTISYIFNNFTAKKSFSSVVREAKEKGLTEPDPRDDLNGMDVARKILILARDAGFNLEPDDIMVENILPEKCLKAKTIEAFFEELEKADPHFENKRLEAEKINKKLRFIALLNNGKATVSLESVGPEHPFYAVSGADNIVSFTTARYNVQPLVVKGPGAGADVTAGGVFADIISIGKKTSLSGL